MPNGSPILVRGMNGAATLELKREGVEVTSTPRQAKLGADLLPMMAPPGLEM